MGHCTYRGASRNIPGVHYSPVPNLRQGLERHEQQALGALILVVHHFFRVSVRQPSTSPTAHHGRYHCPRTRQSIVTRVANRSHPAHRTTAAGTPLHSSPASSDRQRANSDSASAVPTARHLSAPATTTHDQRRDESKAAGARCWDPDTPPPYSATVPGGSGLWRHLSIPRRAAALWHALALARCSHSPNYSQTPTELASPNGARRTAFPTRTPSGPGAR